MSEALPNSQISGQVVSQLVKAFNDYQLYKLRLEVKNEGNN